MKARWGRVVGLLAMAGALSACDIQGLGSGNKLESLEVLHQNALVDKDSPAVYLCFADKLQVIGSFTNGGQADYSTRAHWTSSNPDVVQVSNGDILLPDDSGLAYTGGTLIPVALGSATISVEFVGLTASYDVEVRRVNSVALDNTLNTLAPGTTATFQLKADIDGYTVDVTALTSWSFDEATEEAPQDGIALIGAGTGYIEAVAPGGPLTARASLPLCEGDPLGADLSVPVTVADPQSITLSREFETLNSELVNGTTEAYTVIAQFANGDTQDISVFTTVDSDNPDSLVGPTLLPNQMTAIAAGSNNVQAHYGGDDGNDAEGDYDPPAVDSNTVAVNVVDRTLESISIEPANNTITALGSVQLQGIGHYDGDSYTQPISRNLTWTSSDATIVSVGSGLVEGGHAVSLLPDEGAVTITAANGTADDALSAQAVVCVVPPLVTPGECVVPPDEGG